MAQLMDAQPVQSATEFSKPPQMVASTQHQIYANPTTNATDNNIHQAAGGQPVPPLASIQPTEQQVQMLNAQLLQQQLALMFSANNPNMPLQPTPLLQFPVFPPQLLFPMQPINQQQPQQQQPPQPPQPFFLPAHALPQPNQQLPRVNIGRVLLVSNLVPGKVNTDLLAALFSSYGQVQRVKILYNKQDTALVQFASAHQAARAMHSLHLKILFNKPVSISISKYSKVNLPKPGLGYRSDFTKEFTTNSTTRNHKQTSHPNILHHQNEDAGVVRLAARLA